MDNIYERVKKRDYLGAFIISLLSGIAAVWGMFIIIRNENRKDREVFEKKIEMLHFFYQKKQDSISIAEQRKYQLVIDREREENLNTIKLLSEEVYKINSTSQNNKKLAQSNAIKTITLHNKVIN